jgi:hypothetical protein
MATRGVDVTRTRVKMFVDQKRIRPVFFNDTFDRLEDTYSAAGGDVTKKCRIVEVGDLTSMIAHTRPFKDTPYDDFLIDRDSSPAVMPKSSSHVEKERDLEENGIPGCMAYLGVRVTERHWEEEDPPMSCSSSEVKMIRGIERANGRSWR